MRACYVDSSVVVALMLGEQVPAAIRRELDQSDELISANLLEAEVYAVAAREGIRIRDAASFVRPISMLTPDRSMIAEYERALRHGYCRGADAYHLACALYIDPSASDLCFASCDKRQATAAFAIGFRRPK